MEKIVIGDAVLYHADCMDILPTLSKVDAVITDPPYGDSDTHEKHLSKITLRTGNQAGQSLGFDGISKDEMVRITQDWCDIAKGWVIFTCEWKYLNALDQAGLLVRFGIWRKPDGSPQFTGDRPGTGWEAVSICHRIGKKRWNGGGKHAFWNYPKGQNKSGHPTGKPIGLFSEFISDFTNMGDIVLDRFMGSGTTGVAAIQLGRQFIGIEKDRRYFDIACERIQAAQKQPDLFIETTPEQMPIL